MVAGCRSETETWACVSCASEACRFRKHWRRCRRSDPGQDSCVSSHNDEGVCGSDEKLCRLLELCFGEGFESSELRFGQTNLVLVQLKLQQFAADNLWLVSVLHFPECMGMDRSDFFVTGTDTDVGKTTLATTLALGLRATERTVAPMKPVQTGCTDGEAPDLRFVLNALYQPLRREMLPYAFDPPCSPHLAAALAGQTIDLSVIRDAFAALRSTHDAVVVEGAGGVLVPLNSEATMLDLMEDLALPVVLATRPNLGTLNHTLLTLQAIRAGGLHVAGFVTVDTKPAEWTFIEEDNLKTLIQWGECAHLAHIPFIPDLATNTEVLRAIGEQIIPQILPD